MIKTINDEYNDNDVIDAILGTKAEPSLHLYLRQKLKENHSAYEQTDSIVINVHSWNLGGKAPSGETDITEWIFPRGNCFPPDIVVVGF